MNINIENWKIKCSDIELISDLSTVNDESELFDRFHKPLSFGTGGLRGLMGAGTNRMNIYTVRQATQGIANVLLGSSKTSLSVVIGYDTRINSKRFAEEAALVFASNDIKVFLFDDIRPTPEVSFAVRELKCDVGIVITASHNPPEYNGYKVYDSNGGQITQEFAQSITDEIRCINLFDDVKFTRTSISDYKSLIHLVGEKIDCVYLQRVSELKINSIDSDSIKDFRIVYTPLHGTGLMLISRALENQKYAKVDIVRTQATPDGNFPTVKSPNPEEAEALKEGIKLALQLKSNLVIGTDPDADRVGLAVKLKHESYQILTGNQIGVLLAHYIISNRKTLGTNDVLVKTIVTSDLGAVIAKYFGVTTIETLTGFKYIGEKIADFELKGDYNFIFGYEESHGYLAGTFVRDKDAIIATTLIVEMAAYYHQFKQTLIDVLNDIYDKFGFYAERLDSYTFVGLDGQDKIKSLMESFRNLESIEHEFSDVKILEDYEHRQKYCFESKKYTEMGLPKSNVIKVIFNDNSWFAIRPSGTEPKLKIYYSANGDSDISTSERLSYIRNKVLGILNR